MVYTRRVAVVAQSGRGAEAEGTAPGEEGFVSEAEAAFDRPETDGIWRVYTIKVYRNTFHHPVM